MARARGVRSQLAGVFETTEKTAPGSGYVLLPNVTNLLGVTQGLLEDDLVGTRDPGDADLDNPVADGEIGVPIDTTSFGFWLKALLGAPTTTEDTGVYTHVFESGAWSLPTMALERGMPDVPSYEMFLGAKAGRLRYQMQRGGRLNATVDVVAQGANTPGSSSSAGTPTEFAQERLMQKHGTVTVDASSPGDVMSCDFEYNNNLDSVQGITADGFISGLDELRPSLSGTLRLRFSSESIFATAKAGTKVALSLVHQISAAKKLTLAMPRVALSVPRRPVEGPAGVEATFDWIAARETDGDPMLTATLINAVEDY